MVEDEWPRSLSSGMALARRGRSPEVRAVICIVGCVLCWRVQVIEVFVRLAFVADKRILADCAFCCANMVSLVG